MRLVEKKPCGLATRCAAVVALIGTPTPARAPRSGPDRPARRPRAAPSPSRMLMSSRCTAVALSFNVLQPCSRRERLVGRAGDAGEDVPAAVPAVLDPRPLGRLVRTVDLRQRARVATHRDLAQIADVPALVAAGSARLARAAAGVAEVVVRHLIRAVHQRLADAGKPEARLDVAGRGGVLAPVVVLLLEPAQRPDRQGLMEPRIVGVGIADVAGHRVLLPYAIVADPRRWHRLYARAAPVMASRIAPFRNG